MRPAEISAETVSEILAVYPADRIAVEEQDRTAYVIHLYHPFDMDPPDPEKWILVSSRFTYRRAIPVGGQIRCSRLTHWITVETTPPTRQRTQRPGDRSSNICAKPRQNRRADIGLSRRCGIRLGI